MIVALIILITLTVVISISYVVYLLVTTTTSPTTTPTTTLPPTTTPTNTLPPTTTLTTPNTNPQPVVILPIINPENTPIYLNEEYNFEATYPNSATKTINFPINYSGSLNNVYIQFATRNSTIPSENSLYSFVGMSYRIVRVSNGQNVTIMVNTPEITRSLFSSPIVIFFPVDSTPKNKNIKVQEGDIIAVDLRIFNTYPGSSITSTIYPLIDLTTENSYLDNSSDPFITSYVVPMFSNNLGNSTSIGSSTSSSIPGSSTNVNVQTPPVYNP
jgi:hypothetical protein